MLTRAQIFRLAAESHCDPRTIVKFLEGRVVFASTREAINAAAQRLALQLPLKVNAT